MAETAGTESVADQIVLRAMSRDASLEESVTRGFVDAALELVSSGVDAGDAPELARRLLEQDDSSGASVATIVAAATSEVLTERR